MSPSLDPVSLVRRLVRPSLALVMLLAFVPTALHVPDFVNERGKRYQALAVDCAARLGA